MYNWVTKTRGYIGGQCPFHCTFCYVEDLKRFPNVKERYTGEIRLLEKELEKNEGSGHTIFVQDCSDLFAGDVPTEFIQQVIEHCNKYDNTYLFQTKNPKRFTEFKFPVKSILGISLESNRDYGLTKSPTPRTRVVDFYEIKHPRKMCNIEPICDFDLDVMVNWIKQINPEFVSIGADSKHHGLEEPSKDKVNRLIEELEKVTKVMIKSNLGRLR